MLIQAIINEFNGYFNRDPRHNTVLWFDPKKEWQGLLPHFAAHLPLFVYVDDQAPQLRQLEDKGAVVVYKSQLKMRYLLAKREPQTRFVAYLPMAQEQARFLRPYFYTAKCFHDSIEKTLSRMGIVLPTEHKTLQQIRPLLGALAIPSIGKGRAFWNRIVSYETALENLFPDWEDTLLRFLAAPRSTLTDLSGRGLTQPFFELVKLEFDVEPPVSGHEAQWAEQFTARLCLVELFEDSQKAADFPFVAVLPAPEYRERHQSFLHKWQHHQLFKDAFRQLAKIVDAQYPLGSWAIGLAAPPTKSTFLNVEQAIWAETQQALAGIDGKAAAIKFVRQRQNFFNERANGFWAREGEVPGWRVLSRMAATILRADQALATFSSFTTVAAVTEQYIKEWWKIDSDYRSFLTQLDQSTGLLDAALKWTSRIYQDYLERVNSHFTKLVTEQGTWLPQAGKMGVTALWNSFKREHKGLRAIILVDALRYELAQALAKRLELTSDRLSTGFSPVPSITEVGMAALLPGWAEFKVDFVEGEWQITAPGSTENLARKEKRISWLVKHLGTAAVFDLDRWLSTSLDEIRSDYKWIVVTSSTIDNIGEGVGHVALHTFDTLLGRLEQGVRRLLAAGCTDIYIVTDHGFLLRENVRESEKIKAEVDGILKKQARYLIGRNLPPTDLPHLPVSGSRNLVAWFPPGIGCFVTKGPYNYMHGGIALQEVITPYLHIQQTTLEHLVGVTLQLVDGSEIRNAIFKIRLIPEGVDLLSKARLIELDIVRGTERVSRVWEEKVERDVVEKSLIIESDYGLALGDQVRVRVRDKTTKELLAEQAAVIQVDLEF